MLPRHYAARKKVSSRLFLLTDGGDRSGILERREITEIRVTEIRTANHAAQNLGIARLRQVGHKSHRLRPERPAQPLRDRVRNLARDDVVRVVTAPQYDEHDNRLALDLMRNADRGRLEHRRMRRRRRLDLRRTDAFTGDLQRVVAPAFDVPEPVLVDARPIAVHPDIGKPLPIGREVLLAIAPESACHARPRFADHELADRATQRPPLHQTGAASVRSGALSYSRIVAPLIKPPAISHGPIIHPMSVNHHRRSPARRANTCARSWAAFTGKPPWTCTAPLGRPVVPDV